MAQPGNFTPILLYSSSTPTNAPFAANLTNSTNGAELAINIADKNLFFKDSGGAVNTVPIRQSSASSNGWLSATDWNTFNNKAPATSGTSLLYGNGSGGFSNVTIGSGITFAGGTLSATGSGGTVTSVTGTSPVVSSGGTTPAISLATAYGDTLNPYASKTAKYVLAAPNATAGVPTFRQLANTDITGLGTMSTQNANSVAITGGTLNGVAIGGTTAGDGTFDVLTGNTSRLGVATGTSFVATNGLSSTSTFTGTAPTDGIVIDYSTGYGRFSAFTGDGYQWYTGGIGTTKIMDLSSAGALVTSGTVTANGVLLTGNLGTVTSVTGTSPVVSSGGTTPAISMPAATTSVSGYLTSTDWNTFNSKGSGTVTSVAALTLGTTGTDLSSTVANGTTTPIITLNVPTASATNRGALSAADWTTFNNKQPAGTYVTSVTGTAPVVSSGGTTPAISMAAATTSVSGYLTNTDWTTFNSKQAALVSGTNIKTVNGTTLLGSGDLGIITGTYGGTGVNNSSNTITIAGNLTHAGAFTQTFTATANTSLTLPISGTLISTVTNMAANPVTGTPSASNFLRGDGTWAVPTAGTGTVTSVAATVPAFLSISGSPITTSGTLAISYSGTALPVANGGTATTTTFTVGSVVFAGTSGVYSQDNSNFYWDSVNKRIGLGTTTPIGSLDAVTASATALYLRTSSPVAGTSTLYFNIANNFSGISQSYVQGIGSGGSGVSQLAFGVALTSGATTATEVARFDTGGNFRPSADNAYSNGTAALRWSVIYSATALINTSDATQKQQVRGLNDAEKQAALGIKQALKAFKFNDSVAEKGDKARIHIGVLAQEVREIFSVVGLDANDYGLFCSDTWYVNDKQEVFKTNLDVDGKAIDTLTPVTRLGVRYEELLAFVIAAL